MCVDGDVSCTRFSTRKLSGGVAAAAVESHALKFMIKT